MKTQLSLHERFIKMNSADLLEKVSKGNMTIFEANIAAKILEHRFPSPEKTGNMRLITRINFPDRKQEKAIVV